MKDDISYQVTVHEKTIRRLEDVTNKRFHKNFEVLLIEVLGRMKK